MRGLDWIGLIIIIVWMDGMYGVAWYYACVVLCLQVGEDKKKKKRDYRDDFIVDIGVEWSGVEGFYQPRLNVDM